MAEVRVAGAFEGCERTGWSARLSRLLAAIRRRLQIRAAARAETFEDWADKQW